MPGYGGRGTLASMAELTIKGGRVIDPASGFDQVTDLVIERGRIRKIDKVARPKGKVFDARDCIVCPGLIDPHVHLREPGQEEKETIASGSAAAVAGGFTSICCMPNTQPALDDDGRIEFVYRQAERHAACHVYPVGAITKARAGQELAEIGLMAQAGAVGFSDDGDAVGSAGVMAKALRYVKMTGKALMQHCQEATLTEGAVMNAGPLATRLGLGGWPTVAEELTIQRDILLNQSVGCRYHAQHLTTADGVKMIRAARKASQPITAEVSPHHLLLSEEDCRTYDTNFKMNPPLRRKADIRALIKGVKDGVITILATDHAPHTREDKELDFTSAAFGIIGLECALGLYARALIDGGAIDWPRLIDMMTWQPAQLCDLPGKGRLQTDGDADLTIIHPSRSWTVNLDQFKSKARNCPFAGWELSAQPIATIVTGRIRMNRTDERLA